MNAVDKLLRDAEREAEGRQRVRSLAQDARDVAVVLDSLVSTLRLLASDESVSLAGFVEPDGGSDEAHIDRTAFYDILAAHTSLSNASLDLCRWYEAERAKWPLK